MTVHASTPRVTVRQLSAEDLDRADKIMRRAFGTFRGLPEPTSFMGDGDYVHNRFAADPTAAFGAELDGVLVGSSFATNWGTVAFVGPLSVEPELWDRGIGSLLMEPIVDRLVAWSTRHGGLFTFAESPKHVRLYQKFGFWPRALTAIMHAPVSARGAPFRESLYSALDQAARDSTLSAARALTDSLYEGLDLSGEIEQVLQRGNGDVVLVEDDDGIAGVAICHHGAGSEGASNSCFVKFGAVRSDRGDEKRFERLLDAVEAFARDRGIGQVTAGTSVARLKAYQAMQARGYRTYLQGVAMHRAADVGYHRPDVYAIDDWR